ncbi:hypothetical protein, partial [Azospirillum sp. TSO22-1]|uniref:hypothetical protein n=1 Tax=Azospirillum sp. TSO22-1 TaxID=716789 RepID=UPI000D606594
MRRLASFAILAVLAGCGSSRSLAELRYGGPPAPPVLGSQKPAGAQEIEAAVSGNTLLAAARNGNRWTRHSKPNGYFTGYTFPPQAPPAGQQWTFGRGQWRA